MKKNTKEIIKKFCLLLDKHAHLKEKLYDGSNRDLPVDVALRFATEELGEIATAITRSRYSQAQEECIDLAHCAMLIYKSLEEIR